MSFTSLFRKPAAGQAGLDDATRLIKKVYGSDTRRNGSLVINHCKTVLEGLLKRNPNASLDQQIAALLHDIIEDTQLKEPKHVITPSILRQKGFSDKTIQLVKALTRDKTKSKYIDFIRLVSHNPDAIDIKIADMEHNSSDLEKDDMHYIRYQLCIKYLKAVQSGEVKPGAPIEAALSPQEIIENYGIISEHQSTRPYKPSHIPGYDGYNLSYGA